MKTKTILFLILIFNFSAITFANQAQFSLDIGNLNLTKGRSTELIVTITNASNAELIKIEGLNDFQILSQKRSSETRIINNDITRITKLSYTIMPKEEGEFNLQGIIKYQGENYSTNKLELKVTEKTYEEKEDKPDIFIKTSISEDEIYFGQNLVLSYELYTRYNISNLGFLDELSFNGFISRNLGRKDNQQTEYVYFNDKRYAKYHLIDLILTPTRTGLLEISSLNFQANVSTGSFFASSEPRYLQTEAKKIQVLELPTEGRTADFSGLVGEIELEKDFSTKTVDYANAITLGVTVSANTNLDLLKNLVQRNIPGFQVYETEKQSIEKIVKGEYYAQKEFDIILLANKTGELDFPGIEISYFNPKTREYETAKIGETTINVLGEALPVFSSEQQLVSIEQIAMSEDNKDYFTFKVKKASLFNFFIILLFMIVIIIKIIFIKKYFLIKDKKLHKIYLEIKKESSELEIYNLFNDLIKMRFNISLKANSRKEITEKIEDNKVLKRIYEIMDYIENKDNKSNFPLKEKIKEIYKLL